MAAMKSASKEIHIPVLMYHDITDQGKYHGHDYFRTDTPPKIFEQHMQCLHDNGYIGLTLSQALGMLHEKTVNGSMQTQHGKYVVCASDGYRDFYTEAFPLRKFGFRDKSFLPQFIHRAGRPSKSRGCVGSRGSDILFTSAVHVR
jgi:hypothetical protein